VSLLDAGALAALVFAIPLIALHFRRRRPPRREVGSLLAWRDLPRVGGGAARRFGRPPLPLLLLLQLLALVLLVFALAHPVGDKSTTDSSRVYVVDESMWMGAEEGGGSRIDAARADLQERLGDVVARDHRAERRVGRRDALGRRDHVRLVAEAFAAEHVADAPPRADHLVGDQQHAVAVADLAHALEVAVLRHEAAAAVLHRLEDHRGDRLGAGELDRLLDRIGCPQRVAVLLPAIGVRVRDVDAARRERFEGRANLRQAGRCQRSHRASVVGELARDQLVTRVLAARLVVGLRELPRRLHRLRAARCEEHAVEVAGGQLGETRS